jgi:hypothetical protein
MSDNVRRCKHIKTNGIQCGSPALRNHDFCHFHRQAYIDFPLRRVAAKPAVDPVMNLGLMDDPDGIHYALTHIVYGVVNHTIDRKDAGLALYALQTMSSNFKQTSFQRQLESEYHKSELNAYEIWEKMEREDQEKAQRRLHEKRVEELKKLERTCCKCRIESDDPASLTPPIPPEPSPEPVTPPPPREKQWWEIKACAEEPEDSSDRAISSSAHRGLPPRSGVPNLAQSGSSRSDSGCRAERTFGCPLPGLTTWQTAELCHSILTQFVMRARSRHFRSAPRLPTRA